MRKKWLGLVLSALILVFGFNAYMEADFSGGGAFGSIAGYLRRVGTNILPSIDNTYDLGSVASSWNDLHVDGTATIGTLATGAVSQSGDLTFTNDNPNIIGGDTDGALSITADTATNQGGSIKLYGNTHATLARDIEFYSDAVMVLSYDLSETNWDFDGENVIGIGEITVIDGASINLQEAVTFTGATTENKIEMPDVLAVALDITQGDNSFMHFVTSDGSEAVVFSEDITAIAATITLANTGLHILDTGVDHDLIVAYNEDATQDNTLNIVLSDANRTLTISGDSTIDQSVAVAGTPSFASVTPSALMHGTEALTATDGGVAASLTKTVTLITSENGGVDVSNITLANGTIGQIKIFVFKVETDAGDTVVLTPNTPVGFATITFDAVGDTCTLIFDGTSWVILSSYEITIG